MTDQEKVCDLLLLLGWTHAKAAERLGVHRVTVSRWAAGITRVPAHQIKHLELLAGVAKIAIKVEGEGANVL